MWIDAHNHLQDPALTEVVADLEAVPVFAAVVNGTRQADWPLVRALADPFPWIYPAYGLHPWFLAERTPTWQTELAAFLENPRASLGEIGLDRWMKTPDLVAQEEVFRFQLALAAERNCPASIHCLRAAGPLLAILQSSPLPARGFLLHSFSESLEMAQEYAKLGAFFSFSGHFLHERKEKQRRVFAELPLDRLLVETDAPSMALPVEKQRFTLPTGTNHPGNIVACYEGLAAVRNLEVDVLAAVVQENFLRLFGPLN